MFEPVKCIPAMFQNAESIAVFLSGSGTFLLGISAVVALWKGRGWYEKAQIRIAEETLRAQKQELQRQLKFDIAQEAVDLFHRVKIDFDMIRSPAVMSGESQALRNLEETSDFVREMKKHSTSGIVFMRLDERADTIAAVNRLRARFKAVFDDDEPFEIVVGTRHKIWVAAQLLMHPLRQGQSTKHEVIIWKTSENDELSRDMDIAVARIEELCFPVLRGDRE
jgi:hypothetical protein